VSQRDATELLDGGSEDLRLKRVGGVEITRSTDTQVGADGKKPHVFTGASVVERCGLFALLNELLCTALMGRRMAATLQRFDIQSRIVEPLCEDGDVGGFPSVTRTGDRQPFRRERTRIGGSGTKQREGLDWFQRRPGQDGAATITSGPQLTTIGIDGDNIHLVTALDHVTAKNFNYQRLAHGVDVSERRLVEH
jgi:hypothetical protein